AAVHRSSCLKGAGCPESRPSRMPEKKNEVGSIRRSLVAANWKMNMTNEEAKAFLARFLIAISDAARGTQPSAPRRRLADIVLCAPFTALRTVVEQTLDSSIRVGAQNMHEAPQGAFTG